MYKIILLNAKKRIAIRIIVLSTSTPPNGIMILNILISKVG